MLPPHLMAAAAASWNLENYNLLMRSSQSANRSLAGVPLEITKPNPNHLWQLFTRYEEFLSEKARNYLKIDFSLDQKLYQEPDTIQNDQIRDAIRPHPDTIQTPQDIRHFYAIQGTERKCNNSLT